MKIAIHDRAGSFSDRWISFCDRKKISYIKVNCYDIDIIQQLEDCDALLWHHHHSDYKDALFAKQLLFSIEQAGKRVFPNFNTNWHFDDKVGQKYLLEAIGAPLVPSFVFYEKNKALEWAEKATYPKVFKLRKGAGSANVSLVRNKRTAKKRINRAFSKGFSTFNRLGYLKERYRNFSSGSDNVVGVLKGIARLFIPIEFAKMQSKEKGYVYFQDFIPENKFDTRIIIVGKRAFGLVRGVRENDFRASGSGKISYDASNIDTKIVKIAFNVNEKIKAQSIAFDFISNCVEPLIVEISYGYATEAYDSCPGYWDENLNWHEGKFNPQEWMLEDLISELTDR